MEEMGQRNSVTLVHRWHSLECYRIGYLPDNSFEYLFNLSEYLSKVLTGLSLYTPNPPPTTETLILPEMVLGV